MTDWHLINNDGDIVRTVSASSRADAVALLGRGGTVVSALSWKLDYHKWQPVRTVVTEVVQPQKRKPYNQYATIPAGYLRVTEIAQRCGVRENQIRRLVERYGIPCEIVQHKGRRIQTYSPTNVERIKRHAAKLPERITTRSLVEKRRQAFLERMRERYLARIQSRTTKRNP